MIRSKTEQRAKQLKTCKHFTGIQNPTCDAGIHYDTVKDKSSHPYRWPCMDDGTDLPCVARQYPTEAEVDAENLRIGQLITNMVITRKAIQEDAQGKRSVAGKIKCLICKTGEVHYSIAYNGHIHAQCTTDGCVTWIE